MTQHGDLRLHEKLGLLQATCAQKGYFSGGEVRVLELSLYDAINNYGEAALPASSEVAFECWGSQPVVAGMLDVPAETSVLPFLRYAAAAQQVLGIHSIDMLVVLIGPDGSSEDSKWARVAAAIEDSDRICRKLVWLPGYNPAESAEIFLARSPFARPWRGAASIATQADTLGELIREDDVLDEFAIRAQADGVGPDEFLRRVMSETYDD
jgi:hypothetical protein